MTIKKALMAMLSLSLLAGCASQTAQSEAEETADAMEDKADQILEDAKAEAEKIKEDAEKEAEKIKEDAKAEADKIKEDADKAGEDVEDKLDGESEVKVAGDPQPIGTPITSDGITFTLEKVDYTEGTNQYAMPEAGNNFVQCLVKIQNDTDETYEYNPFYGWEMISPSGAYENYSINAGIGIENSLDSGKLAPGGSIEGIISFEEPTQGKLILVAYQKMFSDDVAAQWLVRE